MDWIQFSLMIISFVGLFIWNRSESRSDMRHMDAKLDVHRQETNNIIKAIHEEIKAINNEMKDFHGRLCSLEERRK